MAVQILTSGRAFLGVAEARSLDRGGQMGCKGIHSSAEKHPVLPYANSSGEKRQRLSGAASRQKMKMATSFPISLESHTSMTVNESMEDHGENCLTSHLLIDSICSTMGFILNVFTLAVIITGKRFAQNIKLQLGNMAIADLLCSILLPSSTLFGGLVKVPYHSNILCKVHSHIVYSLFYSSLLFNTALAVEKFVAVYFPLRMFCYERRHIISVIVSVWSLAFLAEIDILFKSNVHISTITGMPGCYSAEEHRTFDENKLQCILYSGLRLGIPATIMLLAYSLIAIKLMKRRNVGESDVSASNTNKQVIIALAADGMLAVITWGIYHIWLYMTYYKNRGLLISHSTRLAMMSIFSFMSMLNSLSTPLVYLIFNKSFKEDGREVIRKCLKKDMKAKPTANQILAIQTTPDDAAKL
ncbi:psychosine receptor-like [Watersipora subatra]|uniref:psychosine receptor-like n=1 Tax=Watersipora subatra TaxID=2589382 RepID=UPI00355C77D5